MHPALNAIREAIVGTRFDGDLWVVGGAVRDELLGVPHEADYDLVTRGSSAELAKLLFKRGISTIAPVTYERFGTAMVRVEGVNIEIVTARRESYDQGSRKPHVEPATYEEDARRRDFTVNTLMRSIATGELCDPLGRGLDDLQAKVLRTTQLPVATFYDDPLRMLRAVRFRWKLGFEPSPDLYPSIRKTADRLRMISAERIRDELLKMLALLTGADCLADLMDLGLIAVFAPELLPMVGCEQGKYHHLDVWNHTLLVVRNAGPSDPIVALAALLHDVGKPATRFIDGNGQTRFFGHEDVGAKMAAALLRRLKFSEKDVEQVARLVRNHMRLGSVSELGHTAARRLLREMDSDIDRLLNLVEADANGLKTGVKVLNLDPIRRRLAEVSQATPVKTLVCPLSGEEIMTVAGISPGPEVGRLKTALLDLILDGELAPDDKEGARIRLRSMLA